MTIISPASITMIAESTAAISEHQLKRILRKLDIIHSDEDYGDIMRDYKDDTSASKIAKIEACLNYLNRTQTLLGFITELMNANSLSENTITEINRYLAKDGLHYDADTGRFQQSLNLVEEEQKQMSELDSMLEKIDPKLVELHQGAWDAISKGGKDSYRQAISSARELLRQTIDKKARAGSTRKEKIKEILGSKAQAQVVEAVGKVVDEIYGLQSAQEHTQSDYLNAIFTVRLTEHALYYILKIEL